MNLAARVWRTSTSVPQLVQTRALDVFLGSGGDRLTDPRVLFDAPTGRWLVSVSDVEKDSVLLAVSTGSDPTGSWTVSSYTAKGCADQPRLGIADGIVVIAADIFDGCNDAGSASLGNEIWVVNKAQLLAGSTTPDFETVGPTDEYSSVAPVQSLSSTSTEFAVSVDDRVSRVVHLLAIDGVPPDAVRVREVATPTISTLARPPLAGQPSTDGGPRPGIATNDNRVLDSVWENGRLWLTANGRCVPPGDSLIRSCARVVELATGTGTVSWETDLSQQGAHLFYPAVRPDGDGNVVIVAGESGLTVLPEVVVVGRTSDGALTAPMTVARSAGVYRGDRYGDYFGAARDPVNPNVVWVAGEAGSDLASGRGWTTAVASVVVTGAGVTPPVVAGTPPPGVHAVSSIVRVGASIRLAYRALDDGAGVRTVISVRNAAQAFVFRRTTPAGTLRSDQRYFVLWPAKRAHGRFTYCVSTLSGSGVESVVSCVRITVR